MTNPFKALGQLGNLGQMMSQMKEMQQELDRAEISGTSGGDMVTATVNGVGQLVRVKISPTLASGGDIELLEDLIASAVRSAQESAEEFRRDKMEEVTRKAGVDPSMLGGMMGS